MIFRFSDLELDTGLYELRRFGAPVRVEPQVFDLLRFLLEHRDRVVTRDEIVDAVWAGRIVSEATISTCLKAVRQAIGDDGQEQRLVRTLRGRGFRFIGTAEEVEAAREADPVASVRTAEGERPVVAVLAFTNLSAEGDEYFSDGLTEDIITNLSRFRELRVIARTSAFRMKGTTLGAAEIGAKLGAGFVVEGGVRRAGGRVRISVQLIDAATDTHLWAENFDRELEDIFEVQDEVTRTIAAKLGVQLQDAAMQRALRKNSVELDAWDCVMRARPYTASLTEKMHSQARELLERAVALDPASADAAALLGNVYLAEHRIDHNPRPDPVGRAFALTERATRLDPQNAYARCWLAIIYFFMGENDRFLSEAERALALNPSDPETLADIGHYLAFMGEFDRGVELSMQARKLNPLHPGWYHFASARRFYHLREYEAVLRETEQIGMPHFYWMHMLRVTSLGQLGRLEEAEAAMDRMFDTKPDFNASAELKKWNAAPEDFAHLMAGLFKAGYQGGSGT